MRKLITAVAITSLSTSSLLAAELNAIVTQVEPNYETITEYTPVKICRDEQVPIYGNAPQGQSDAGNVLLGMILGGVSGKVITGDDGGAAIGAIAGGLIGANNNNNNTARPIVGYQTLQSCTTENRQSNSTKLRNYKITYNFYGAIGSSYSYNNYNLGDNIPVYVNVTAK
ncbi:hypothetical protein N9J96_04105 [Paracoccaceae bacterium]|jgi:uncharacterized protein YcfJ|nr:hypothetical protein [Paracoccaceae bacterium]